MHKLIKIASYKRHIASNHERMFENVFDWEHLPHLHSRTFSSINLLAKNRKTLKFEVGLWPAVFGLKQTIKLQACKRRRTWIVRVLAGFMKGLIIRSRVGIEKPEGFDVQVNFYIPRSKWYFALLGPVLKISYQRLYDEDVAMMTGRQKYLDNKTTTKNSNQSSLIIGREKDISFPHPFNFQGKSFLLAKYENNWIAYSAYCPHMQRQFSDLEIINGIIRCPWHGYEFDLKTGLSKQSNCRLTPAPRILKEGDYLRVVENKYGNQKASLGKGNPRSRNESLEQAF